MVFQVAVYPCRSLEPRLNFGAMVVRLSNKRGRYGATHDDRHIGISDVRRLAEPKI